MTSLLKRWVLCSVVFAVVLAEWVSGANLVISNSTTFLNTPFGSYEIAVGTDIPQNYIPVALRFESPTVTNGVLQITGWGNSQLAGRYAFTMEISAATLTESSIKIVNGLPRGSVVSIRTTVGHNSNGLVMIDFSEMFFVENVSISLAALDFQYTGSSIDSTFISVGGPSFPTAIADLSSIQVTGIRTQNGGCIMSTAEESYAQSVASVMDHALLSISLAEPCGLSKSVLCVNDNFVISNHSMVRLWNINPRTPCFADAGRRMVSVLAISSGGVTISDNSMLLVKNIGTPQSEVVTTGRGTLSSNTVMLNSTLTIQNITASAFCSTCILEGFASVEGDSRVFAGPWTLNGAPVDGYAKNGLGGAGSSLEPTIIDVNGKTADSACTIANCLPSNSNPVPTTSGPCTCPCIPYNGLSTYSPHCTFKKDDTVRYSWCDDAGCFNCPLNPNTCSKCFDNYVLRSGRCYPVVCRAENCRQCVDGYPDRCELCAVGYHRDDDYRCVPCTDPYCYSCTASADACDTCIAGYTLVNGKCVSLSSLCQVTNCEICETNNNQQCRQCKAGYGLTENKLCQACSEPHCIQCYGSYATCERCEGGYTLTQYSTCSQGPCSVPNCGYCDPSNPNKCIGCISGYDLDTENGVCVSSGTCLVNYCIRCETGRPNRCAQCNEGYQPDSNGKCQWMTGYCKVPDCAQCTTGNAYYCQQCNSGYAVTSTGQCTSANTRCLVYYCAECQAGQPTRCYRCYSGYGITTDATCVKHRGGYIIINRSAARSSASLVIVALSVFMSALLLVF